MTCFPASRANFRHPCASFPPTTARKRSSQGIKDVQATLYIAFVSGGDGHFRFSWPCDRYADSRCGLPLSLLLTFVAMNILGYSLDNLSLMASPWP